jgi:hypothetical protein
VELYIGHAVSSYTIYQYLMVQPNGRELSGLATWQNQLAMEGAVDCKAALDCKQSSKFRFNEQFVGFAGQVSARSL